MYPYETTLQWFLASRYQHLVTATEGAGARLPGDLAARLERRRRALVEWSKVRTVLVVALYFGIIAASLAWIFDVVGLGTAGGAFDAVARITTGLAGLFAALFLLVNRLLGQLEIDMLALLALNLPDPPLPLGPLPLAPGPRTKVREERKTSRVSRVPAKNRNTARGGKK